MVDKTKIRWNSKNLRAFLKSVAKENLTAATAFGGMTGDRAGGAVFAFGSMGGGETAEAVTFHTAGKPFALACAREKE